MSIIKFAFEKMMSEKLHFACDISTLNIIAIFQVYINQILHNLVDNFCIIYLDNILVFFKTEEEHYQHLKLVIKYL